MRHLLSDALRGSIDSARWSILSLFPPSLSMDLEGFEDIPKAVPSFKTVPEDRALEWLDNAWFVSAVRSSRWMDLLGDYAGSEPFVIDGEALFRIVLDDPLLAIGRNDCSFQILHAYHTLESILSDYQCRSANFEIVFWDEAKHLSIQTGEDDFVLASRALARSLLFRHLLKLPFAVHVFKGLDDPLWAKYVLAKKPMFVMTNDGGLAHGSSGSIKTGIVFSQRAFMLSVLSHGLAVALLKGAEYRDSKILSFVFEPKVGTGRYLKVLRPTITSVNTALLKPMLPNLRELDLDLHLRFSDVMSDHDEDGIIKFFQDIDILSSMKHGVPCEVVYLFIAHSLFLPILNVRERSQVIPTLAPELIDPLRAMFLAPLFLKAASLLASQDCNFEVDGTVFSILIAFLLRPQSEMPTTIDRATYEKSRRIWRALEGPPLDFTNFAKRYALPQYDCVDSDADTAHTIIKPYRLLPFNHPVFGDKFAIFQSSTDPLVASDEVSQSEQSIPFLDNRHWHNAKSILPAHQGGSGHAVDARVLRRRLRSNQRFMATMQVQAASLTGASGAILRQIVIAPVGTGKNAQVTQRKSISHNNQRNKAPVLSSADKLRLKIKEEKESGSKNLSETRWTELLEKMKTMSPSEKVHAVTIFLRNPKVDASEIVLEARLFRLHIEMEMWVDERERDTQGIRDRYTVSVMRMVKDMAESPIITSSAKKSLSTVLKALGFGHHLSALFSNCKIVDKKHHFRFVKLIDSNTGMLLYDFMAIKEHPVVWQLRLFGEYMDRSMDSQPDRRVAFQPDAWQRRVLDGIDQNKSILVVAPTSAGKTFISYYAMEQVLRQSDDGILVYIAPTKALVTQIAAEVYARFRKDLKGRSCWAIHTRDYRVNDPQTCQILITVPEILAIMLLSPPLAKVWTPRIKRIVLDEIHSIGQQEGGAVWEQIVLFAPCPIIGLSATIGTPEKFSNWLSSVQQAHGFQYDFIEHSHRYSHLRKFFYKIDGQGTVKRLDKHQVTRRALFLHPISLLLFGARTIPPDLSLEAPDTLTLFNALYSVKEHIDHDLESLKPDVFFASSSNLLRQKDVLKYETQLKSVLTALLQLSDPSDRTQPLGQVIWLLQDPSLGERAENLIPSRDAFKNDLPVLLADLFAANNLPAILFNFDRSDCELMAQYLVEELERSEKEWRAESPEWNRKLKQVKEWEARSMALKRASEKSKKMKKRTDDEDALRDAPDASWESKFKPDEPSPQFSFVDYRVSYSASELDKAIKELEWTDIPKWAFAALRRGIAVHHAGMNKHYRSLVESLFRLGFVRVMIATGTLALGINAPAKTSVFCGDSPYLTALMYRQCAGRAGRRGFDLMGNVIFYGLTLDRTRRLTLSRLPTLGGNFPLTSTLTLRLLNLLHGSQNSEVAIRGIQSLLSLPQISLNSSFGGEQLLHHLRFSIEFLRRSRLLDASGRSINLFGIAAHLYYTEPSNFALVKLLDSGALHSICSRSDGNIESAKKDFMIIMANLFGRRYLSKIYAHEDNIKRFTTSYPSMVVLPPIPEAARKILAEYDQEILQIFSGYAYAFATASQDTLASDDTLPLSGISVCGSSSSRLTPSPFHRHLQKAAIDVVVRSPFVSNSGHNDICETIPELTRTARAGLNLNGHAIPSMSHLTASFDDPNHSLEHRLNAYLFDFYIHGQVSALIQANGIRRGDIWYLLQDFHLTLMTVKAALEELLFKKAPDSNEANMDVEEPNTLEVELEDIEELETDNSETLVDDDRRESDSRFSRSGSISAAEDKVYRVVSEVCAEFEAKFREMWA